MKKLLLHPKALPLEQGKTGCKVLYQLKPFTPKEKISPFFQTIDQKYRLNCPAT
ncbi:hypothetical protein [Microscilla marina]|uniref:Uncharacterized protein n=1 Tax=Microscilla marina ATCC 23134 TaxID=313606 RepID=A1ZWS1_MICM2|nr:hypothetical protein [Microscilla marina]EAY25203.1 hypothetical protein M23134_06799 [Microscilla marina ATCC 23134]